MSTGTAPLLDVANLSVTEAGATLLRALHFSVARGELVGVIGPNGAGKSTLLRFLAGVQAAQAGTVQFDGTALTALNAQQRAQRIAWLEQRPQLHWPLAVEQVVALGRLPWRGTAGLPGAAPQSTEHRDGLHNAVARALDACGLQALRRRDCTRLSEGEKLLVNLARVLATDASLILADEPTAALDPRQQLRVMALLQQEAAQGKAVLAVLHDLTLAARYCSRLLLLHEGALVAAGTAEEVLTAANLAAVYGVAGAYDPALRTVIISGTA